MFYISKELHIKYKKKALNNSLALSFQIILYIAAIITKVLRILRRDRFLSDNEKKDEKTAFKGSACRSHN